MKRNIEKDYSDYLKLAESNKAGIYPHEVIKILQMAKGDPIGAVTIGLGVGVMIGYRLAKRERQQSCCHQQR